MSTRWSTETGEFAGTAWASKNGPAMDWGTKENSERMMQAAMAGESFESEVGERMFGSQFMAWAMGESQQTESGDTWTSGRESWTYGEFGGTFEMGSGEYMTWMGQ